MDGHVLSASILLMLAGDSSRRSRTNVTRCSALRPVRSYRPGPCSFGRWLTLTAIAHEIAGRLIKVFVWDDDGRRPVYSGTTKFQEDLHWRDFILFYEYFHGDNGAGMGASHHTGGTCLIARVIEQQHRLLQLTRHRDRTTRKPTHQRPSLSRGPHDDVERDAPGQSLRLSPSGSPSRNQARTDPFPFSSTLRQGPKAKRSRSRRYTASSTPTRPGSPCDSRRLAVLTVSPQTS